jgi:hypothetical protein
MTRKLYLCYKRVPTVCDNKQCIYTRRERERERFIFLVIELIQ